MPENTALLDKRERQARRLLRVCLRPLLTGCLEEYVKGYEAGTLRCEDERLCALGHMGRAVPDADRYGVPHAPPYHRISAEGHRRESCHIEAVFEGWLLQPCDGDRLAAGAWGDGAPSLDEGDAIRRRWIYEACLEELARRASIRTPAMELAAR